MCLKKMFIWWRNNVSFRIWKGYPEKIVLSEVKAWYRLLSKVQSWRNFVFNVYITKHPFEGYEMVTKTIVLIWKWKINFIQQLHNLIHDF